MNKKQLIVMWVGIAFVVLMGILPPMNFIGGGFRYKFGLLLGRSSSFVDFGKLLIQCSIVGIITVGLIITFKDKKPEDEEKNK